MDPWRSTADPASRRREAALVAAVWTVVASVLLFRYADLRVVTAWVAKTTLARSPHVQLWIRAAWALLHCVGFAIGPMLVAKILGIRWAELGLIWGILSAERNRIYLVCAGSLPVVLGLSFFSQFQSAYPMFRSSEKGIEVTVLWLCIYSIYLFSIELYFRGFLLSLWTPFCGPWAMGLAMIPYVATHRFVPEMVGAVPVGILLGVWRMRSGSIVPGFVAHLVIATEIELCGLWQASRVHEALR